MKVSVDLAVCTGHARCQVFAPAIFSTDEIEGQAVVIRPDVDAQLAPEALRGARSCPERAITLHDDMGSIVWPPQPKQESTP
ncbi:ferredoxin [Sphingomonas sp.]|uniref:ferredoxin n=1 Tax=Sphingomonas sp. TaxID=28214 RepID=UPI003D6DA292